MKTIYAFMHLWMHIMKMYNSDEYFSGFAEVRDDSCLAIVQCHSLVAAAVVVMCQRRSV